MKRLLLFLVTLGVFSATAGQGQPYVQITGTILDRESLQPASFATVIVKGSYHGTVANAEGLFTLLVSPSDTIQFSMVGYLTSELIVPAGLQGKYALVELLEKETIVLRELEVYPWPSVSQFNAAFMDVKLPPTEQEKTAAMQRQLEETIKKTYRSQKYYDEQWKNRQLYQLTGQIPPNHFLDPVRWAEFIEGLKKKK